MRGKRGLMLLYGCNLHAQRIRHTLSYMMAWEMQTNAGKAVLVVNKVPVILKAPVSSVLLCPSRVKPPGSQAHAYF